MRTARHRLKNAAHVKEKTWGGVIAEKGNVASLVAPRLTLPN